MQIDLKLDRLRAVINEMKLVVLAYSGGVDSSLLLAVSADVLGPQLLVVTAESDTVPPGEIEHAKAFALKIGVRHRIIAGGELREEDFIRNDRNRCYYCKRDLFSKLRQIADVEGIPHILDGSNLDDQRDFRPGRKAAQEFSVRSPLCEAELSKEEIRELARRLGLSMWNKPSLACLSSRIPYGTRITPEILKTIGSAEDVLRNLGFGQVRVRHHGDTARIELDPAEFNRLLASDVQSRVTMGIKSLGYAYVCLDLQGYRTGSMNETRLHGSQETEP